MEIAAKLLALASSVSWDGGDGVLRALRQILREDAPFDAGEVALFRSPGFQRWTLTDDEGGFVAEDLLERAASAGAPLRIDDALEPGFAPLTRRRMAERGLRSCLALGLSGAGGPEGAIVIARDQGWAFTGAPLHTLWPVASMTGLCLARAVALTALRRENETLRVGTRAQEEVLRKDLTALEDEAHALRRAAEHADEARAVALARERAIAERLAAASARTEELRVEVERWRGEAERLACALRDAQALAESRTAELASAIQRLAELDRRLGEREVEASLAPPPPPRRRRRSRGAPPSPEAPDPPSGGEPGPASGS